MLNTDDISTIFLAKFNSEVSLLTRMDRKYLIPPGGTQHVINHLVPRAQVLQIDGLHYFCYASTYFDTPGLDAYFLTARKRRRRYKTRIRARLDSGLCFPEVKTSGLREATIKDRFKYDPDDADRVTSDDCLLIIERLVESGTCSSDKACTIAGALVLVMGSTYSRITLYLPHDETRVTFDTQLIWDLFDPDGKRLGQGIMVNHLNIVETKNPSTAFPMDCLLWHQGCRSTRISKYATGIVLLYADLSTNRWNCTTKRDLGRYWRRAQSRQLAA